MCLCKAAIVTSACRNSARTFLHQFRVSHISASQAVLMRPPGVHIRVPHFSQFAFPLLTDTTVLYGKQYFDQGLQNLLPPGSKMIMNTKSANMSSTLFIDRLSDHPIHGKLSRQHCSHCMVKNLIAVNCR